VDNALSHGLYDGIQLFPELLQKNGYRTVFAGKWHVSAYEGPEDRGFDTVLREYISNYGRRKRENRPSHNDWIHLYNDPSKLDGPNETKTFGRIIKEGYPHYSQFGIDENPFGDSTTVELACNELDHHDGKKPLFLYIGTTGPHDPYSPPREFLDLYNRDDIRLPESFFDSMLDKPALYRRTREQFALTEEEHRESIRRYLAFVSYEDALFGRVLDAVERNGMWENTIVLYLTDHGDYMGAHGLWAKGLPCFREAYNICAIMGGCGIRQNIQIDSLISMADFATTLLEIAGIKRPTQMVGHSLLGFLQGNPPTRWRSEHFTQTNGNEVYGIQRAVWNKKWKYVYNAFDYDELYDLENDPNELHNVVNLPENKPVIRQMCKKLWTFAKQTGDNCTCDYIMVRLAPYGPGIIYDDLEKDQMIL
jgi:arylsulfatase A-like enzyme